MFSWSGKCVPKYGSWNHSGQQLKININNDIEAWYSYTNDKRDMKKNLPVFLKKDLVIAIWKSQDLSQKINKKFNVNGWFFCKKKNETFDSISFGKPFNYEYFIQGIKNKKIIFDSGMKEGNSRLYSQFRAGVLFWKSSEDNIEDNIEDILEDTTF